MKESFQLLKASALESCLLLEVEGRFEKDSLNSLANSLPILLLKTLISEVLVSAPLLDL